MNSFLTGMTDSFMRPKGGIYSTQSLVLNHTVSSKDLSLHIVFGAYLLNVKVELPIAVCGCILGCKVLCTIFWGHCDLDLWPQF